MKVLNLYAGIGGNRKLWKDVKVVAIELNKSIANAYQHFFPNDDVFVTDAHQFLLEHFKEFDFIWSSPPCQSHSRMRKNIATNLTPGSPRYAKPIYPDLKLYEEILFLKHYFKGKWCVENIKSFYKPLIEPQEIQRHYFWTNFPIEPIKLDRDNIARGHRDEWQKKIGLDISKFKLTHRKDQILCNCVRPELGLHILRCARGEFN